MQELFDVPYSDRSSLNTLNIWIPQSGSECDKNKIWIVYIHGGAWRDPLITSRSFLPSLKHLQTSPHYKHIAGYASLNYRLSPYPSHPTSPSSPSGSSRNAKHPDHISDILSGIAHLQRKYRFGSRYILAGHSCGATLALQTLMPSFSTSLPLQQDVEAPSAVVGIEGIYCLPSLVSYHADKPYGDIYTAFVTGAFSSDPAVWRTASPALAEMFGDVVGVVVLAHSRGDELVEWEQVEEMRGTLLGRGFGESVGEDGNGKEVVMLEVEGKHDEVWEDGREVARAIGVAVERVISFNAL